MPVKIRMFSELTDNSQNSYTACDFPRMPSTVTAACLVLYGTAHTHGHTVFDIWPIFQIIFYTSIHCWNSTSVHALQEALYTFISNRLATFSDMSNGKQTTNMWRSRIEPTAYNFQADIRRPDLSYNQFIQSIKTFFILAVGPYWLS